MANSQLVIAVGIYRLLDPCEAKGQSGRFQILMWICLMFLTIIIPIYTSNLVNHILYGYPAGINVCIIWLDFIWEQT